MGLREWIGLGVFLLGLVVLFAAFVKSIWWWIQSRERPGRERFVTPDGRTIIQSWWPFALLGMGLIQLAPAIGDFSLWWRAAVWLVPAAFVGLALRRQQRSSAAVPVGGTERSEPPTG